jgi:hypothetical protein
MFVIYYNSMFSITFLTPNCMMFLWSAGETTAQQKLFRASENGDVTAVRALLAKEPTVDINARDEVLSLLWVAVALDPHADSAHG